jgi:hypothetical protein
VKTSRTAVARAACTAVLHAVAFGAAIGPGGCASAATGRSGRLMEAAGEVPVWVGGGVDASDRGVCPAGFVCRLGESGPEQVKTDALAAARSAAYAALVAEAFPSSLTGKFSVRTTQVQRDGSDAAELGESVEQKVDASFAGRIEGTQTLESYWERRSPTPSQAVYYAWVLMGVRADVLRETFPREQAKAREAAAKVSADVAATTAASRASVGPEFLASFERLVVGARTALDKTIPEREVEDARAQLAQLSGWVTGNTTVETHTTLAPQKKAMSVAGRLLVGGQAQANAAYALVAENCRITEGSGGVTDPQGRFRVEVELLSRLRPCALSLQTGANTVEATIPLAAPFDGVVVELDGGAMSNDHAVATCLPQRLGDAHAWFPTGVSAGAARQPAVVRLTVRVVVSDRQREGSLLRTAAAVKTTVSVGDGTAQTNIAESSDSVMSIGANDEKMLDALCDKAVARVKSSAVKAMEGF